MKSIWHVILKKSHASCFPKASVVLGDVQSWCITQHEKADAKARFQAPFHLLWSKGSSSLVNWKKKKIGLRLQCQFESRLCFLPFWCLNFVACCVIYWACKMNILQLKNLHVPVCTLRISQKGGFRNWGKKGFMNSANFFLWVLFFFNTWVALTNYLHHPL